MGGNDISSSVAGDWDRDLARFLIDELNGLYDRLQDETAPDLPLHRSEALARMARFRTAAAWLPPSFAHHLASFLSLSNAQGSFQEDTFGAAALLLCMGRSTPDVERLFEALPAAVLRTLEVVGLRPSCDGLAAP